MKIAILGTRGIPARYGGFETFAEELSVRLVQRGHEVTVYGRKRFFEFPDHSDCQGVKRRVTSTFMSKYFETPIHAITSFLDLITHRFDVVLLCNAANSPFAWIGRLLGMPIVINVDGIERERKKWNGAGRLWYRLGEWCSVKFGSRVVADAEVIAQYYLEKFRSETVVIGYGALVTFLPPGDTLERFRLQPNNYVLYVSRLEPENNALGVIEAYQNSGLTMPLVIVGDAPYATEYKEALHRAANDQVIFTGFQFGDSYKELRTHCLLYVQATEVGGTHPALVEAMAYGNAIIVNGTPENLEVAGDCALSYPKNNFSELTLLLHKLANDVVLRQELQRKARTRANEKYTWDDVTLQYEALFMDIISSVRS